MENAKREAGHQRDQKPKVQPKNPELTGKAGRIKIDFYTDPLCCWSWAFDRVWTRFMEEHRAEIDYRYVMCGMIPDWRSYNDPLNSVSRPIQMGPIWMHASEVTKVRMKYSIWHESPPASSYPACIAVKAVALQSQEAEHQYLYQIRRALMEEGKDISKPDVLISIAKDVKEVDYQLFEEDWKNGKGKEAFRADLQLARFHNIGRFPTLTFRNTEGRGIIVVGYRPFEVLEEAWVNFSKLTEPS